MWGNAVRGGGTYKNPMRLSMWDGPMKSVKYMWVNIRCSLLLRIKFKESILPSSFYGKLPDY